MRCSSQISPILYIWFEVLNTWFLSLGFYWAFPHTMHRSQRVKSICLARCLQSGPRRQNRRYLGLKIRLALVACLLAKGALWTRQNQQSLFQGECISFRRRLGLQCHLIPYFACNCTGETKKLQSSSETLQTMITLLTSQHYIMNNFKTILILTYSDLHLCRIIISKLKEELNKNNNKK